MSKVWIGCLACYNSGELVGQWYDAIEAGGITTDQVHAAELRERSIDLSPLDLAMHEELWVFDHEDLPVNGECSPVEAQRIAERCDEIEQRGWPVGAVHAYADNHGHDFCDLDLSDFEDAYCGEWDSEKDYAYDLAEDIGAVPEDYSWPASYIDWDAAARDLFMTDNWSSPTSGGDVYVFRSI